MKLYLDTGNVSEVEEAARSMLLDGITTNPSLIAKEGKDFHQTLNKIISVMNKYYSSYTVSAEVTDTKTAQDMIRQGKELAKLNKHIVVKIPLTYEGLIAVNRLSEEGIRCNVTLCFSANQALLAAKAGAYMVSPFIGRIDDEGYEGLKLIEEIRTIFKNYGFETQILAASIRSTEHILGCAKLGADIATMPFSIFQKLYLNPLTDIGLEKFNTDWKEYNKNMKKKPVKKK